MSGAGVVSVRDDFEVNFSFFECGLLTNTKLLEAIIVDVNSGFFKARLQISAIAKKIYILLLSSTCALELELSFKPLALLHAPDFPPKDRPICMT